MSAGARFRTVSRKTSRSTKMRRSPTQSFSDNRQLAVQIVNAGDFAGGRMIAPLTGLKNNYTVEFWLWNSLPAEARPIPERLFQLGIDQLMIAKGGKLALAGSAEGITGSSPRAWQHVALVRQGSRITVYLNGSIEITTESTQRAEPARRIILAGAEGSRESFEGKLDEVAVYARALREGEVAAHYKAAR